MTASAGESGPSRGRGRRGAGKGAASRGSGRRGGRGGAAGGADAGAEGAAGAPYHHGDLRRALVEAGLEILSTEGAANLTLRETARRAGVSQAAPYRHFADKDALLAAVAERGFRMLAEAMARASTREDLEPLLRFRANGEAYVAFATGNPALFQLMFGTEALKRADHPGLQTAARETFGMLVQGIEAGQRAGFVREGDPQELAVGAWAVVHGVAALLVNGQFREDFPPDHYVRAALGTLFLGLRREGG